MDPNYFEGTLQLRNCSKEIITFVKKQMKEENVTIASTVKLKNGYDYKVSSNKFMIKLAKAFEKQYSGVATITRKLYSRDNQTGKEVYRITVKLEQLPYKIGDVIDHRGEKVKVLSIGKKVTVKDKSGKKFFL